MRNVQTRRLVSAAACVFIFAGGSGSRADTAEKAASLIIPHIEFKQIPPKEVFAVLRRRAKDLDPEGYGINFVFKFSASGAKAFQRRRITMTMDNIPVSELIEYICMGIGFKCSFEENAVLIFDPKAATGEMQTRIYHLEAGVMRPRRTRKKPKKIKWRNDDDD